MGQVIQPIIAKNIVPQIKQMIGTLPIMGICMGHQLLALAQDGLTEKLPFGHRGSNHPVKDLKTGQVWVTSQNHGYVVKDSPLPKGGEKAFISLFDQSIEGVDYPDLNMFSVQFHPEAAPGPNDAFPLFTRFKAMMKSEVVK